MTFTFDLEVERVSATHNARRGSPTLRPFLRSRFFGHSSESFFDAIEWNADKVGVPWLPRVGRPGSIMVSRTCDIGHVILGVGYPPKVGISIMLADSKSHGILLIDALRT
jgi:hypothetical protein